MMINIHDNIQNHLISTNLNIDNLHIIDKRSQLFKANKLENVFLKLDLQFNVLHPPWLFLYQHKNQDSKIS